VANLAQDKEWLESQYQDKTSVEIAAMIGMSASYIKLQLKRLGIPTRKPGRRAGSTNPHTPKWNRKIALSHMKYKKLKDKEWLRGKYEDEELSCRGVADVVGCLPQSVWKALKIHGIPCRPEGLTPEAIEKGIEASRHITGPDHHAWRGGKSFDPYPVSFNNALKRAIRERDNYVCQGCGEVGNVVHHIDYDKENCDSMNLITTCRSCNARANCNRERWEVYYMDKQLERTIKQNGGIT